ncbi:MAG: peroxiredoxin [Thermoguttaceae bacterium]|nr:peroxiredoxin [Thermoguttaceae bacterium]MDW8079888.1 peroxiredoxin [Thermoguttaceae bacterium]
MAAMSWWELTWCRLKAVGAVLLALPAAALCPCAGALGLAVGQGATKGELAVGDEAPDFELPGSDGKTYRLSDFRGKSVVVIAWFPKAFTPGCTRECKSLAQEGQALAELGVVYFAASCDKPEDNRRFAESLGAKYPILSDPDRKVALAYGVVDDVKGFARRWTFVIGKDGKILHIDKKVNVETHAKDLAAWIKQNVPNK